LWTIFAVLHDIPKEHRHHVHIRILLRCACPPARASAPPAASRPALLLALALLMPPPALAAGIVVTTANEGIAAGDGCSLREAITNANADNQSGSAECNAGSGADTITFAGDYTITLASTLPDLTGNLTIDGTGHTSP
jgi:hypothetical protein